MKLASRTGYRPLMPGGAVISSASIELLPARLEAAAVMTQGPPAGEPMVPRFGPSLPAATTASTPALVAAISAMSSGAVSRSRELPTE